MSGTDSYILLRVLHMAVTPVADTHNTFSFTLLNGLLC